MTFTIIGTFQLFWNSFFRYDCRGHLFRLQDFDFSESKSTTKLSSEEMDVESILDEERYMDLHKDNTEDEILNGLIWFIAKLK